MMTIMATDPILLFSNIPETTDATADKNIAGSIKKF